MMKHPVIVGIGLLVCLLAVLPLARAGAESPLPETVEPSSIAAPDDYVPTSIQGVRATGSVGDVLLVQGVLPWESEADAKVLESLGYTYDNLDMSGISLDIISEYQVVIIVDSQKQIFYDQYAFKADIFEDYVSNGGSLVFLASYGWPKGKLEAALPGGVEVEFIGVERYNYIANKDHPIVTAVLSDGNGLVDSDLYSYYCSMGYFESLPPGAIVILEEQNGYPTLIEYPVGQGKVIASLQTWEWSYDYGPPYLFARKALDDLFLYAFMDGPVPDESFGIDLRIDDAPDSVTVNKSRGSYVDVVARLSGDSTHTPQVTLRIPGDVFGAPVRTFTRDMPNNEGIGQENEYDDLGAGGYRVETALEMPAGQDSGICYREIVWRFRVPLDLTSFGHLDLVATMDVPDVELAHPADRVSLNIMRYGRSIAITDRQLLFDRYGSGNDWHQVSLLLEAVYRAISSYGGEVFYADCYGIEWNQSTDIAAANNVSDEVDIWLEDRYEQLSDELDGITLKPEYLLIIGGDEIIPFQRIYAPDYGDEDEHEIPLICPNSDPVIDCLCNDYFLSDNVYADVGGSRSGWGRSNLELATGRIIGATADDMRAFVENGSTALEPFERAVLMSSQGMQTADIEGVLHAENIDMYGLGDPDLVDTNDWTQQQFLEAWQMPYQLIYYGGHGVYDAFFGPGTWAGDITVGQLPSLYTQMSHPLLISSACNLGVPTRQNGGAWMPDANDSVIYKLVDSGMAGMVTSTGIISYDPGENSGYGERLINEYVEILLDKNSLYTNNFGRSLMEAKNNYLNGLRLDRIDEKTVLEYVYYGLPWSFMDIPDTQNSRIDSEPDGYEISYDTPELFGLSSYSQISRITITDYRFSSIDTFELLQIPGTENIYATQEPVLPCIRTTLYLPAQATVSGVQLVSEHSLALGEHSIPLADPATMYRPTSGYTSATGSSGWHPSPRYSYEVVSFADRTEVRICVVPAALELGTNELSVYDETILRVDYDTAVPVLAHQLTFSPEYQGGDVDCAAIVENVGADDRVLTATLTIYDAERAQPRVMTIPPFGVSAGGSCELSLCSTETLPYGGYDAVLSVYEAGTRLAATSGSFFVLAGHVKAFDAPTWIRPKANAHFSLTFANTGSSDVNVSVVVNIYSENGLQVARLVPRYLKIGAQSDAVAEWTRIPTPLADGGYTMEAIVTIDGQVIATSLRQILVSEGHSVYLPNVSNSQP